MQKWKQRNHKHTIFDYVVQVSLSRPLSDGARWARPVAWLDSPSEINFELKILNSKFISKVLLRHCHYTAIPRRRTPEVFVYVTKVQIEKSCDNKSFARLIVRMIWCRIPENKFQGPRVPPVLASWQPPTKTNEQTVVDVSFATTHQRPFANPYSRVASARERLETPTPGQSCYCFHIYINCFQRTTLV